TVEDTHRRADDARQRRAGTTLRLFPAHELAAARRALDPRAGGSPRSPRRVGRGWREGGRMSHYHDSDDLKLLGEMKTLAPVEFRGFIALDNVVDATTARSRASAAS